MTDRELIELAAKAAGLKIDKSSTNGGGSNNTGFDMLGNAVIDWHNGVKFNPLESDADAFRLAVKLQMRVHVFANCVYVDSDCQDFEESFEDGFSYAATRRAITRAAAEIGKVV